MLAQLVSNIIEVSLADVLSLTARHAIMQSPGLIPEGLEEVLKYLRERMNLPRDDYARFETSLDLEGYLLSWYESCPLMNPWSVDLGALAMNVARDLSNDR